MRPSALIMLAWAAGADAQDLVQQGEEIFNRSCATGYCHGARGLAGSAPRLAARGFDEAFINATVTNGVAGTAMPGFAGSFPRRDVAAVVAYVAKLNGLMSTLNDGGRGGPAQPPQPPSDALRGRELFQDAMRRATRCSTCHERNGIGIPVAAPISTVPASPAALRTLATPQIGTATVDGEAMPALVVSEGKYRVLFYDLTATPPVLRTVLPSTVKVTAGNAWRHASVAGAYSDEELTFILAYLRTN